MSTLNTIQDAIERLRAITTDKSVLDKLDGIQIEALDAIDGILRQEQHQLEQAQLEQARETISLAISPVVSKLQSRPVEELIGMAKNRRKELEPENTGAFLQHLIADMQKAQEQKHEFNKNYASVLSEKDEHDTALRVATRNLYGAVADAIESNEIKLDKRRVNEAGEELASYELPSWLPAGLDIQNDVELVIPDTNRLMREVRSFQIWEVVSLDTVKLERYLKRQEADLDGKITSKFADPFQLSAIILPKVKPVVGKDADWTPPEIA